MSRTDYYEEMKSLARDARTRYKVTTQDVSLSFLRSLYKIEGIRLDYWPYKLRKVRGAYIVVEGEPHVLVNSRIAVKEPKIFILAHELKHHLVDRERAEKEMLRCQEPWESKSLTEIGAEVFAAEFVYPEAECLDLINRLQLTPTKCSSHDVVKLKRACPAPVSYAFIIKRLEWFKVIQKGQFKGVHFQKLEEELFGPPFYKAFR